MWSFRLLFTQVPWEALQCVYVPDVTMDQQTSNMGLEAKFVGEAQSDNDTVRTRVLNGDVQLAYHTWKSHQYISEHARYSFVIPHVSFTVYIYMFTSHSPRNITAKNNYNYIYNYYVHGVDGNDAASLEVLSAGRATWRGHCQSCTWSWVLGPVILLQCVDDGLLPLVFICGPWSVSS